MISIKKCYFTLYKRSVINEKFYKDDIFQNVNQEASVLLKKGVGHLTNTELYSLNKHLLKSLLGDAVEEVSKWGNADGTDILKGNERGRNRKSVDWSAKLGTRIYAT